MPHDLHLITDPRGLEHDNGPGHPERPERLTAVVAAFEAAALPGVAWTRTAAPADDETILRAHVPAHVADLEARRGRRTRFDADTATSPGSVEAARVSAGAAVAAARSVTDGTARRAWALTRPPGHHAEPDRAMGFCLLSNLAIAALDARARGAAEHVLVVDFDVHHGNGTQAVLLERDDVTFVSIHQWPLYPGTGRADEIGRGPGRGFTVNLPMPAGAGDDRWCESLERAVDAVVRARRPDLVLVSAGFDGHADDPLAATNLTEDGYARLARYLCAVADDSAGGRLALVLEGGYHLPALTASAVAVGQVLVE